TEIKDRRYIRRAASVRYRYFSARVKTNCDRVYKVRSHDHYITPAAEIDGNRLCGVETPVLIKIQGVTVGCRAEDGNPRLVYRICGASLHRIETRALKRDLE